MSEIRANTVSDAAGTGPATLTGQYAAKAWVNFNGTGTIAARDSENVSSLTDDGTGEYTVNLSNAFGAADYAVSAASGNGLSFTFVTAPAGTPVSGSISAYVQNSAGSLGDVTTVSIAAFGDLA